MSFLNDDDDDELDDSKKSDFVIFRSRCLTRLNESTIVETLPRIFMLNESIVESTINETLRRFTQKRVFIVFVIFHRDIA